MKTPLTGSNAMSRLSVFLIAACILAATPRLSGDIILVSRLSDAEAAACGHPGCQTPPPQSQTGFLPANLCNTATGFNQCALFYCNCSGTATSTSNSSILINNPMEGLRVVGDGTARASGCLGAASAKLIVLSFTLTEVAYPYSMTGQLNGSNATAKLTGETGTIFERVGTTLSESGTLPPGSYTLSVDIDVSVYVGIYESDANFAFALDGPMSTPTPTPTPIPVTRATNLSTRLLVGTFNDVGIGGFIVTGNGPRHVLIRGIGPFLSQFGILNFLSDPSLQVYGSAPCFQTLTNNNWRDTQEGEIIATGRAPSNDLESAIVADLAPGSYTAVLRGAEGTTAVGLVEIYDLSTNQDSRLANISTRGNVRTGDDIMIAGFILGGASGEDSIILRGIGPSLSETYPSLGWLPDPKLELRNSQGGLIASNDNWMDDPNQAAIIQAVGLAPSNNLESAIAATLMPGEYTALLSGVNNGTGVGLVEVYENPPTPSPTPTPVPTPSPTPCCADDSWRPTALNGVPMPRSNPVSVWTGTEMIVWGGIYPTVNGVFDTGGRYNPETDSWIATSMVNVPDARGYSTAVWTGSEMIVWGGTNFNNQVGVSNTGGRYDPVSDTWTATNLTNAPTARFYHTAVWTGSEMIVWGGRLDDVSGTFLNTGARYDPVTDTWLPISTVNAPDARFQHTAVWTGSEMIVWGGSDPTNPMNTGGRYNPLTDSWASLSVVDAPSARTGHTTVWTGQEMIVWGGSDGANVLDAGARYDPNSNSWLATGIGPQGRMNHSAVWSGNEMIIWAGRAASFFEDTNTGSRYNPDTDTWRSTNLLGAPFPRTGHAAVWSGHQMIVWGGFALVSPPIHLVVNDGGRYFASPPPTPSPPRLPQGRRQSSLYLSSPWQLAHLQRTDRSLFRTARFFRDIDSDE